MLLGQSRSSIYRAIERGDLPLPVFTINGRPRTPVGPSSGSSTERSGSLPARKRSAGDAAEAAGRGQRRTTRDRTSVDVPRQPRRDPMCSAARRSSADTAPV